MYFSFSCSYFYFFFCRFIYFENAVLSRKFELIYECTVGIFSILQSWLHIYHWHKRLWCAIVYCLYIKHKMNGPCTNKIGGRTTLGERHSGRTASGVNKKKNGRTDRHSFWKIWPDVSCQLCVSYFFTIFLFSKLFAQFFQFLSIFSDSSLPPIWSMIIICVRP